MKDKLFAHQKTISILSKQKEAQIKLYKAREGKELDKVIEFENKVKVLDNIVYKTAQSVQTMNMRNNKCRTSFAKPEFLKKAQRVNPRRYDIDIIPLKQYILNEKRVPKEDECIMSIQSQGVSVWEGAEVVHLQAEYSSRSSKIFSRILYYMSIIFFLLVGNVVTNSRVTSFWRKIVSLTF
nr:hypothetical protein [Tanacetum cinerariifolium]